MIALVLDHLWQSTLLALGLGLLALAFRRASASVRHCLWLSASVKFLVPFAALAMLGRFIGPAIPLPAPAAPQAALLEQAAEPFSQSVIVQSLVRLSPAQPAVAPAARLADASFAQAPDASAPLVPAQTAAASAVHAARHLDLGLILQFVPWVVLVAWALGSSAIAVGWIRRWMRLRKVMRSAKPLAWPAPMPVLSAPSLVEPGLLGLWRPVLLLPESLPEHLSQVETAAVIAHEACHLRRRDNLTAALHMVVEAVFWFHPLVWWIGARLIAERERACDEAVVEAGHDRAVYARSLVESCRLYLQSPLDCVAGASGSNLKTRVEAIMTAPPVLPLSPLKKTLLLAAGAFAFATPVAAGLLTTPEAQKAVAPLARAVATIAAPARTLAAPAPAADQSAASQTLVLARSGSILAPAPSLAAAPVPAPEPLTQAVAAPPVDAPTPPQPAEAPAPSASTPAALAGLATTPLAEADRPEDLKRQALSFVKAASLSSGRYTVGRWLRPICVQVAGLPPDQAQAVRSRVEDLAGQVGISVQGAGCATANIEIGFTDDPQGMLKDTVARNGAYVLGDNQGPKTVTLPIQSWYKSNGLDGEPQANLSGSSSTMSRGLFNVMVIVDLRRTGGQSVKLLTDYAATLALSEHDPGGRCNVLPSMGDLFVGPCPGRGAPDGVTSADHAYLVALYQWSGRGVIEPSNASAVAERMAKALSGNLAAASASVPPRSTPVPPSRAVAPASLAPLAWMAPGKTEQPASLLQLASYSSPDLSRQTRDFVQTNARVGQFGYTVRWQQPLCLKVVGLTPEQNAAVMSRIRAVGQTLAGQIYSPRGTSCPQTNATILFSTNSQRTLDNMIAHDPWFLGDARSDTRGIKTVTRPIQAWRVTVCDLSVCRPEPFPQQPLEATVLVDARRVDTAKLGAIADYVAMLVLADPRNLDHCQPLPSVLDLFVGPCPGRSAPIGLTLGDLAFLKALYTAGAPITQRDWNWSDHGGSVDQIAGRMGMLLAGRGPLLIPGAKPVQR